MILAAVLCATALWADAPDTSAAARPEAYAVRLDAPVRIDGVLSEPCWAKAPPFTALTQRDPVEGGAPTERTDVRILYDDAALYVGARMFDRAPDSIVARLARRDAIPNSDLFVLYIDPYLDRRSGFYFGLDAAGTIYDGTLYNDDWTDASRDAVWEGMVNIDSLGWTAEMRIPFSQLRFHDGDAFVWGIDFERDITRKQEVDYTTFTPKNGSGFVSRFVTLSGIRNISPPRQVEILPFVTTRAEYIQHAAGDPFNNGSRYKPNIGADVKVGLGSNLTLDAAVNPDFGQVEVDPAVVNLSDVETFFDEKRPFFIEGSSIFNYGYGGATNYWSFNWGNPTLFYSRRIGRAPQGSTPSADFADVPGGTTILGAAKISGKIGDNWDVGSVQALTAREYAQTQTSAVRSNVEVEPLTYYNVARLQKGFNQGRQGIGVITTITARSFSDQRLRDELNSGSYVVGLDGWSFLDSSKTWVITGWGAASRANGSPARMVELQTDPLHYYQQPDARSFHLDSAATSLAGYAGRLYFNKQRGDLLVNGSFGVISPGFDDGDLGYLWRTNIINTHLTLGYQWVTPTSWYRRNEAGVAAFRSYNFDKEIIWEGIYAYQSIQLLNYYSIHYDWAYNPQSINTRRTRGGPVSLTPQGYQLEFSVNTDNRKSVVFGISSFMYRDRALTWNVSSTVEWRPSPNIDLSVGPTFEHDEDYAQWVGAFADPLAQATYANRYVFAFLRQATLSANIRLNWAFTPRLCLQLFLQPLISAGNYTGFKELLRPGSYEFATYGANGSTLAFRNDSAYVDPDGGGPVAQFGFPNPNFNIKSLRGNAVLRWEYTPGSTLYLVWTQSRYQSDVTGDFQFNRSVRQLVNVAPDNIFMLKMTYWWNR